VFRKSLAAETERPSPTFIKPPDSPQKPADDPIGPGGFIAPPTVYKVSAFVPSWQGRTMIVEGIISRVVVDHKSYVNRRTPALRGIHRCPACSGSTMAATSPPLSAGPSRSREKSSRFAAPRGASAFWI
jgi:hypothetical protein